MAVVAVAVVMIKISKHDVRLYFEVLVRYHFFA